MEEDSTLWFKRSSTAVTANIIGAAMSSASSALSSSRLILVNKRDWWGKEGSCECVCECVCVCVCV